MGKELREGGGTCGDQKGARGCGEEQQTRDRMADQLEKGECGWAWMRTGADLGIDNAMLAEMAKTGACDLYGSPGPSASTAKQTAAPNGQASVPV